MATDQLIRTIHSENNTWCKTLKKRKDTLSWGIPRDPIPFTPLFVDIPGKKVQETQIHKI